MSSIVSLQWLFLGVSVCVSAVVGFTLYSSRQPGLLHRMSAFRLRPLAALCNWSGAMICIATVLWVLGASSSQLSLSIIPVLLSLVAGVVCMVLGYVCIRAYPKAARATMRRALRSDSYMRIKVIRAYLSEFPDDIGAFLPHLCDASSLRIAARLISYNATFQGRPLVECMADILEKRKDPQLIRHAFQFGLFRHRSDLETRMQRMVDEDDWIIWENILSHKQGAPRVGHVLEQILEDAVTYQNPHIALELTHRERLDKAGRTAVNALMHTLSEHFEQLHLVMDQLGQRSFYAVASDHQDEEQDARWRIVLEPITSDSVAVEWEDYDLVQVQKSSLGALVRAKVDSRANQRLISKGRSSGMTVGTSDYPMLRLRCSMYRGARLIESVEADSAFGLQEVQGSRSNADKRGMRLIQRSAQHLVRGILAGAGLRILHDLDHVPASHTPSQEAPQGSQHTPQTQRAVHPSVALAPSKVY